MKKVAVISNDFNKPRVVAEGTNDGQLIDKYYTKVNGELYFAGTLVRQQDKDTVIKLLAEQAAIVEAAKDRAFQIQTIFNNILTDGLNSTNYPDIRNQEWFKQVKATLSE